MKNEDHDVLWVVIASEISVKNESDFVNYYIEPSAADEDLENAQIEKRLTSGSKIISSARSLNQVTKLVPTLFCVIFADNFFLKRHSEFVTAGLHKWHIIT